MINVHLRLHYGADDRFDVASKTLISNSEYFKSVRLVNLGPDENSDKFKSFTKKIPNLSITNFGKHYNMCTTADTLRHHIMDIPDGEWVVWMDSDWRIPECTLRIMQYELMKCEAEGINHIFSHQLGHRIEETPTYDFNYTQETYDQRIEDIRNGKRPYGWPLFEKVDKKNIYCNGFLGNHPHIVFVPYNKKHIPEMFHFHFRDFRESAYCGSSTFLCWWYLGHHVFEIEEQIEIQSSKEFHDFEAFKEKYKCYTSNHLYERINRNDVGFLEELKRLFLSFEGTNIFSCKQMYLLASKYDMKFYKAPIEPRCEGICCRYKGKQIQDLHDEFVKDL